MTTTTDGSRVKLYTYNEELFNILTEIHLSSSTTRV